MHKNIFLLTINFIILYAQAMDTNNNDKVSQDILIATAQKLYKLREAATHGDFEANCAYQDFFNVCMNGSYTLNESSKKKLHSFGLFDKKKQKIWHKETVVRNIDQVPPIIDQINQGHISSGKKSFCIVS